MANSQGLSLLDIGVPVEQIVIGEKSICIRGISVENILILFQRFPQIRILITGGKIADLLQDAPNAIAGIIAAGCGNLGDPDAEAIAVALPMEMQLDILEAIGRLTFKSGFGPFVKRVTALANAVASASSGKVMDTNSPPQLNPLSIPDSITEPSGP